MSSHPFHSIYSHSIPLHQQYYYPLPQSGHGGCAWSVCPSVCLSICLSVHPQLKFHSSNRDLIKLDIPMQRPLQASENWQIDDLGQGHQGQSQMLETGSLHTDSSNQIGVLKSPKELHSVMSQVTVKDPKVKVKHSKLDIYASSFGSSTQIILKSDRCIEALEGISQCK